MNKKKNDGFTLIELMIIIALITILVAVGVPQMIRAKNEFTLSNDMRLMLATINRARLEAVKLGTFTAVAFTPNPPNARPFYTAFVDNNRNGVLDPGEAVIARVEFHSKIILNPPTFASNSLNGGNSMHFNATGFPLGIDAAGTITNYSGSITANLVDDSMYQRLRILPSGRMTIAKQRTPFI